MRFVKEAVRLGLLMFAGQLVADGLTKLVKSRGGHWCRSTTCCQNTCQEITEKEEKKSGRRKSK
jgi:hypothetical protein